MASTITARPSTMRIRRSTVEFEVNYFTLKDLPVGDFVTSPTFIAGGYNWALHYYAQGHEPEIEIGESCVSLFLSLQSEAEDITAWYSFELLDKNGEFATLGGTVIDTFSTFTQYGYWGSGKCIRRDRIEDRYCNNGLLVISCNVTVSEPRVATTTYPNGLTEHMKKLLEEGQRYDVTFEVEGEIISAHRLMLAARSPVFEAQLFGTMAESKTECIKISEMRAEVFKTLLRFIYTDQLAEHGSTSGDHGILSVEMLQHLFVAADRYALDKLRRLCEEQLGKDLSVSTVATTLLLADQHSSDRLKNKCLEFASDPQKFKLVAVTEGYFHIMEEAPLLFAELSEKVRRSRSPLVLGTNY